MKKLSILTTLIFAFGLCMVPATFAGSTDSKDKQSGQSEYQKDQKGQAHTQQGQNFQQQKQNLFLVENLIGSEIQDHQGEKIGDIDKVLVDVENGQVGFVTVASGGVLGVGDDKYIVPFNALQMKKSQGNEAQVGERQMGEIVFTLNTHKHQLKEVPQGDIEEALTQEDQSRGIFEHYGVAPYWEGNQRQQDHRYDTQHQMMDKKDQPKNQ